MTGFAPALPWRWVMVAVSGVFLALSFPPFGASLLAPVAVALFVLATYRVGIGWGLALGFAQGMLTFTIMIRWISLIGWDAWIALSAFCAGWIAIVGAGQALVTRLRWWPLWIACLWVAQEALRDRIPFGGFPWGRLAFAQTATSLTPWAAVAGAPAVTFVTALAGAVLAFVVIVLIRREREWRRWAAAGLGGLLVIGLSGALIPRAVSAEGIPRTSVVALIQGGVPSTGLGEGDQRRAVLDRHVAATIQLAEQVAAGRTPQPEAVIWPENSVDIDPYTDPSAAQAITTAAKAIGVPILVGAVIDAPGDPSKVANVGIVWSPATGPGDYYVKRQPVPFGEFVPFRSLLTSIIGRFDRVPRDFIAGSSAGVLSVGPMVIGDVICFEIAYDGAVRDAVVGGGRAIVVQTNNATFSGLGQPEQQIAMSRLRAVEHGRTVVVAATSGISAVIDPTGAVVAELPDGAVGTITQEIELRDSLTLADRLGPWPEWLAALLAVVAVAWAAIRRTPRAARSPTTSS